MKSLVSHVNPVCHLGNRITYTLNPESQLKLNAIKDPGETACLSVAVWGFGARSIRLFNNTELAKGIDLNDGPERTGTLCRY